MSTLREVASLSSSLGSDDYKVLRALAEMVGARRYAPIDSIARSSGLSERRVELSLSKLHWLRLVFRESIGYRLLYSGLDALALHDLNSKGALDAVGLPIALGKESDVYEGISAGKPLALKVYRIGRISFRGIRRSRRYASGNWHEWMLDSIRSSSIEFRNLSGLYPNGLPVPRPITRSYHILAMERIQGVLLRYLRDIRDPQGLLEEVLMAVRECYLRGGVVNADLSEYNVMVDMEQPTIWHHVLIIDWPQAVPAKVHSADVLLERDVRNILNFFTKRFGLSVDLSSAIGYAKGLRESYLQ